MSVVLDGQVGAEANQRPERLRAPGVPLDQGVGRGVAGVVAGVQVGAGAGQEAEDVHAVVLHRLREWGGEEGEEENNFCLHKVSIKSIRLIVAHEITNIIYSFLKVKNAQTQGTKMHY